MTTPDVIDLRAPQWDADAPCDLEWVLTAAGPSFNDTPSNADIEMTRQVRDAGKALGVTVHDHVVIGRGGGHASFKSMGLL